MFDPYHKWLAIPPGQRPPTHYQLLGVAPTEADPEVIEEAVLQRTAHLRAYQTGPHAQDCTRMLNEIAAARLVVLDPAKRKEYDARLAASAKPKAPTAAPKARAAIPQPPGVWLWLAAGGAGIVVVLGVALALALRDPAPPDAPGALAPASAEPANPKREAPPATRDADPKKQPVESPARVPMAIALRQRGYIELTGGGNVPDFNKDFTIEFWCRWDPKVGPHYLAGNEVWPSMSPEFPVKRASGWVLRTTNAGPKGRALDLTVGASKAGKSDWHPLVGPRTPDPVGWQHLAVVRAGKRLTLYRDGKEYRTADVGDFVFHPAPGLQYVGIRKDAHGDRHSASDFKAFRISSRPRYLKAFEPPRELAAEADDLVNLDFAIPSDPTRILDRSPHGRNGMLRNTAAWMVLTRDNKPGE